MPPNIHAAAPARVAVTRPVAQVTGEQMSTRDLQSAAAGAQLVIMATSSARASLALCTSRSRSLYSYLANTTYPRKTLRYQIDHSRRGLCVVCGTAEATAPPAGAPGARAPAGPGRGAATGARRAGAKPRAAPGLAAGGHVGGLRWLRGTRSTDGRAWLRPHRRRRGHDGVAQKPHVRKQAAHARRTRAECGRRARAVVARAVARAAARVNQPLLVRRRDAKRAVGSRGEVRAERCTTP